MTTTTDTHLPSATDARFLRTGVFSDPDIWPSTGELDRHPIPGMAGEGHGLSVLVVDDNPVGAETLADLLCDAGHTATTAYSPLAAIAAARRSPPDVILIDVASPGFDGVVLGRQLGGGGPVGPTLIAVSDGAEPGHPIRAAGFDFQFQKPVDGAALLKALVTKMTAAGKPPMK